MAIKFKRKNPVKWQVNTYNVDVYKGKKVSAFLLVLCIVMFLGSAYFLINRKSDRNLIYTEGRVVKKTISSERSGASNETDSEFITIEFSIRSGRYISKDVRIDSDSFNILKEGDVIPLLYHYDPITRDVEIVTFGRYPIGNFQKNTPHPSD